MQVFAISTPKIYYEAQLLQDHHRLRAWVFSTRTWDVEVVDDYGQTGLTLSPRLHPGCHRGWTTCRMCTRFACDGTDHAGRRISVAVPEGPPERQSPNGLEFSLLRRHLEEGRGDGSVHETTLTMFAGIVEWCLAGGLTEVGNGYQVRANSC